MYKIAIALLLVCAGCGVAPQPESLRTVAAFDVPLSNAAERAAFVQLLRKEAEAAGFHVDAATDAELRRLSEVSPISMNATVWRGKGDDEVVASAMSDMDDPRRIWISFDQGSAPARFAAFRQRLMRRITLRWPGTLSLPIMPTGAIPLSADLIRTPSGYVVNPTAAAQYQPSPAPSSEVR